MTVLDASAVLAFLQGEPGADAVEAALEAGAQCGAANWSEVAQKSLAAGRDWESASALLAAYGFEVAAVTAEDGEWAARRWRRGEGLSLADRLCLALANRLGAAVMTADAQWGTEPGILQIR
ncbi:MAG: type II toxin-antitoxin system VapC family toxin [Bifidobacteriaceae bacterium]|jgi:PIN domain nuclease of toxin-antitoxin system|nr:type II toxin-antitoxin system VapC family toxin [Bifidobacteriaceae bacterium]